jgi:hypothetical protein
MRSLQYVLAVVAAFACFLPSSATAQYVPSPIEQIAATPSRFAGTGVDVTGLVTMYAPSATSGAGHYLLRSESGSVVRVNTSKGAPDINRRYRVTGIVQIDPVRKTPSIAEESRVRLNAQGVPDEVAAVEPEESAGDFWLIPLIVLLVAALAAGAYFGLRLTKRKADAPEEGPEIPEPQPEIINLDEPLPAAGDLKTVRITPADPMVTLYIPGELVLISGEDKGRSFRIAGFHTPEGSIVTIGREQVTGDRAFAHIQIDERYHTVSRKQAELIWAANGLSVRNLSETNPTQVNGVKIERGKSVPLPPGAVMRTGELEFEYRA